MGQDVDLWKMVSHVPGDGEPPRDLLLDPGKEHLAVILHAEGEASLPKSRICGGDVREGHL